MDSQIFERVRCTKCGACRSAWIAEDPARRFPTELIKRHAATLDFSSEFFQLSQNPIIGDQCLTTKNPTARARRGWRIEIDAETLANSGIFDVVRWPIRAEEIAVALAHGVSQSRTRLRGGLPKYHILQL
jgi:hypothetical protein